MSLGQTAIRDILIDCGFNAMTPSRDGRSLFVQRESSGQTLSVNISRWSIHPTSTIEGLHYHGSENIKDFESVRRYGLSIVKQFENAIRVRKQSDELGRKQVSELKATIMKRIDEDNLDTMLIIGNWKENGIHTYLEAAYYGFVLHIYINGVRITVSDNAVKKYPIQVAIDVVDILRSV